MEIEIEKLILEQDEFMGQSFVVVDKINHDVVKDYILSFDESIEYDFTSELDNDKVKIWFC